jgi:hypothetical protein
MIDLWRNRKALTLIAATLICGATAAVSIALAYAQPVSSATLGTEWQCHHVAIMTTCTRISISRTEPTAHHVRVTPVDLKRV